MSDPLLKALGEVGRSRELENTRREREVRLDPRLADRLVKVALAGRPKKRQMRWATYVMPLAAAAAVAALYIGRPTELPPYALDVTESQKTLRSADEPAPPPGVVRIGSEAPLFFVARPARRPSDTVAAHVFGWRHGTWGELEAKVIVSEGGSAQVEIPPRALVEVEALRVVIGRKGESSAEARARAERGDALHLRIKR